jgi:hypothetical protein
MQGHSTLETTTTDQTTQTTPSDAPTDDVYSAEEKKALEDRLKSLGYL